MKTKEIMREVPVDMKVRVKLTRVRAVYMLTLTLTLSDYLFP